MFQRKLTLVILIALWMFSSHALAEQTWKDKRLTLDFKNTSLQEVLDTLAEKAGISYSVGKDVLDSEIFINAKLKDIPVTEAIEGLMKSAGLEYTLSEHGLLSVYLSAGESTEDEDKEKT